MTLREEVISLNETAPTEGQLASIDKTIDCMIECFETIGKSAAANRLRGLKERYSDDKEGYKLVFMRKIANLV